MANRSPRCLHCPRPPGSLRPKRWLPPHARRGGKARPEVGGARRETLRETRGGRADGYRRGPGPAPKSLPWGSLSGPGPTHWRKQQRGRSSRPLRRGGSVHWGAEAAAGGGQRRRRAGGARDRAGGGRECRGRARPRSTGRAHASPPHLRGRRVPWEPMASDAGGQSPPQPTSVSANQEAVSWGTAGTSCRAHVLVCVPLRRKEKGDGGAASLGLGTLRLLLGKALAGFGRRCWEGISVFGSQACIALPALGAASLPLSFSPAAVPCRVAARSAKSQFKKADFSLRGSKPLVPLLSCVTVGSFLPGYPTMGHVTDRSLCHRTLGYSLCPLSFSVMKFDYCVNTSKNIK